MIFQRCWVVYKSGFFMCEMLCTLATNAIKQRALIKSKGIRWHKEKV